MTNFTAADVDTVVQPCPLREPPDWIELELLGEDGMPIPGLEFRVILPNADIVEGFLDQAGVARIENITPGGSCQVMFPELDFGAWRPI